MPLLSRSDEIDLLTELHDGVHETPRWATFLGRMQRRMRADHVSIVVGQEDVPIHRAARWFVGETPMWFDRLGHSARLGSASYHRLRPGRVYAASEMIEPGDAGLARFRRDPLPRTGLHFGRFLRITERTGRSAWLSVTRKAEDFTAADSALLSALAPHLAIALHTLVELERVRWHAAAAEETLRRAGIGWTLRDQDARLADHGGAQPWDGRTSPPLRAPLRPDAPQVSDGDHGEARAVLVVPFTAHPLAAAATDASLALTRTRTPLGAAAEDALMSLFHLSRREAGLAARLANGESLAEAAGSLGLTIETVRNYSKRLFGKMGARGQADLVRLVLTSIAGLA